MNGQTGKWKDKHRDGQKDRWVNQQTNNVTYISLMMVKPSTQLFLTHTQYLLRTLKNLTAILQTSLKPTLACPELGTDQHPQLF